MIAGSEFAMATGFGNGDSWEADSRQVLPCNHQELVNLRVFELVVGVPDFGFQLLLDSVIRFTCEREELSSASASGHLGESLTISHLFESLSCLGNIYEAN